MIMLKYVIILMMSSFALFPSNAAVSQDYKSVFQKEAPKDFDEYVEGALQVYSQFKTPSKESSEDFYKFVKNKWADSNCNVRCDEVGYKVAKEYVEKNKIPIKPPKQK